MKSRVLVGFARMEATCRRRLTRDEVVSESYDSVPKSKQRSMSTVIVCCGSCSRGVAGTWGEKQDSTMQYSAGLVSAVCTLFTSGLSGDVTTAPATSCPSRSSLGLVLFEQKGMCSDAIVLIYAGVAAASNTDPPFSLSLFSNRVWLAIVPGW